MLSFSGGNRTRTDDLKAMILASYQLLHSAIYSDPSGFRHHIFGFRDQVPSFGDRANFLSSRFVLESRGFILLTNQLQILK